MERKRIIKIGIVTPDFGINGGVQTLTSMFYAIISKDKTYVPEIISIATQREDKINKQLLKPATLVRSERYVRDFRDGISFTHWATSFSDIEICRYFSDRKLNSYLKRFDLILVISSTPVLANIALKCGLSVILQVATTTEIERRDIAAHHGMSLKALMTKIVSKLDYYVLKNVSTVLVENNRMYQLSMKLNPNTQLMIPGIDNNIFVNKRGYNKNGYLLTVGRLTDERKNLEMLLKAYALFKEERSDKYPRLVLAGSEIPHERIKEKAHTLGIEKDIEIIEKPSTEKLVEIYSNASIFILTSKEEGLGLVILEAMACGLPVIATKCGGPEMLINEGENGYLLNSFSEEKLSIKIDTLWKDCQKRLKISKTNIKKVDQHFNKERTEKEIFEILEREIIEKK